MQLTIYLQKEIPDRDTGLALIEVVKQKLTDHPEIVVTANINEFIRETPSPEPPG